MQGTVLKHCKKAQEGTLRTYLLENAQQRAKEQLQIFSWCHRNEVYGKG